MIHMTDIGTFSKLEIDSILNKVSERYDKEMQDLFAFDSTMEYLTAVGTIPMKAGTITFKPSVSGTPWTSICMPSGPSVAERELAALKRELEALKAEKAIRDRENLNAAKEAKTREEISKIKAEIDQLYKELSAKGSSE